jgi:hypothetical protein
MLEETTSRVMATDKPYGELYYFTASVRNILNTIAYYIFCSLVIQQAKRIRHIILPFVVYILFHSLFNIKLCFDFLHNFCLKHLIQRIINEIIINDLMERTRYSCRI